MKVPFQRDVPDPLRTLLAERLDAIAAKARQSGGIEKADLEPVESLARLCALADTAKPKKTNPVLGGTVLLVTMGAATFLMFGHIPVTEIETETALTSVTFRIPRPTAIMGGWRVRSLGISGFDEVALPAIQDQPERTAQTSSPFRIEALDSKKSPGSVSLAPIHVAVNTLVTLEPSSKKGYRMLLKVEKGSTLQLQVNVLGSVRFSGLDSPDVAATLRVPRGIAVTAGAAPLDLALEFPDDEDPSFLPLLPVDRLGFINVEEFGDGTELETRVVSSILSGTLYYESLDGRERKLRENEEIHLSGLKGVIRSIRLKPGNLVLRYDGAVRGIVSGSEAHAHNLMPSWLEFLKAQRPVELLWATGMYLFGMVMAALKWFKIKV
jgi:hypothetical protein